MLISKKTYENLSEEDKDKLEYSNPCITNTKNILRVGEVFDDYLNYWRPARENDF